MLLGAGEIAKEAVNVSVAKVNKAPLKTIVSAFMAGMFIGFGYFGYLLLASGTQDPMIGKFFGAFLFPVGIILVVFTGTDLFTGNCLVSFGFLTKKYKVHKVFINLGLVYLGNLLGALFLVSLVYGSKMLDGTKALNLVHQLASQKTSLGFFEAIIRGILCNYIVSLSVYIAFGAKDPIGKIFALLLPVMLFVISGFEHSVANMFILPLAKVTGAEISVSSIILKNLIPVTLGNIISGSILVPLPYYFLYLKDHA